MFIPVRIVSASRFKLFHRRWLWCLQRCVSTPSQWFIWS